jgi:hypothetical protein
MTSLDSDKQPIRLKKAYDYQLQLTLRRWQYFATYLILNGILFAAFPDDYLNSLQDIKNTAFVPFAVFPMASALLCLAFSNLVGLATERIYKTERLIGIDNTIAQLREPKKFLINSETLWTYLCIYVIAAAWVVLAFKISTILGISLTVILLANLLSLRWRAV